MSMPKLIDSHTHMQFAAFKDDAADVIARALEKNIWVVNVGTQQDTSKQAILLAEQYEDGVYATVGLHPIHTERSYHDIQELGAAPSQGDEPRLEFYSRREEFSIEEYTELARHPKVVAIGECGLDYYRVEKHESPHQSKHGAGQARIKQEKALRAQIELALEVGKPLMIHCRDAFDDLIKILTSYFLIHNSTSNPGIIHFFSGTEDHAKKLLEMGFSFTFGGVITFVHDYDKVVRHIPIDRILSETDAPYVTPAPYRGKRNEPSYVEEVVKKIAELKDISFEEAAEQTVKNAKQIFGI